MQADTVRMACVLLGAVWRPRRLDHIISCCRRTASSKRPSGGRQGSVCVMVAGSYAYSPLQQLQRLVMAYGPALAEAAHSSPLLVLVGAGQAIRLGLFRSI